ncbi:MAG: hypothetical protein KDJ30_10250 [Rhodoblastus sp.]|nr:hypothetical protein [Rhodoblastus sp.]
MARFDCKVPFKPGETWRRQNFFSPEMKPIGENPSVISVSAPDLPAVVESAATKTEAEAGWGGKTPVVEVYLRLATPASSNSVAIATIEAAVDGALLSCGEVADACDSGSSG